MVPPFISYNPYKARNTTCRSSGYEVLMFETKIEEMQPDLRRKEKKPVKKARESERETVMSMSAGGKNVSIVNNIKVSLRKLVDGSPNKNDRF